MHRESYTNRYMHSSEKVCSEKGLQVRQLKTNGIGVPIPTQKHIRRQSTNESDDSTDSSCFTENNDVTSHSPVTAFSRSFNNSSHSSHGFNVYSMSPRSTSVMYQYYSTPKGFYQNQVPLMNRSNGYYRTDENASCKLRYRNCRTLSECCESSAPVPSPSVTGFPQTHPSDVVQDPRRRAWSESDSNRRGSIATSRLSALKKLRKKLGRSSSLKKRRDENYCNSANLNHSITSMSSLEKVEEGRQLDSVPSNCSSKRNALPEEVANLRSLSLHQEDETRRSSEFSPDRISSSSRERTRTSSTESVFNHDGELIYQRFLEEHTCYDIMPRSCKLVVFDTRLQARKAFHALIANSVRSAPLWDSDLSSYVGMLTVTDFIRVILKTHKIKDQRVQSVEEQTIRSWRNLLNQESSFASVRPDDSLLYSLNVLFNEHFHGVPIMDQKTGDIFHIINHKRILRFLYLFMNELPKPNFMNRTLSELHIGRFEDIPTITKCDTILDALELLTKSHLSAIPVVDKHGEVVDLFCKLDMISLAAQGLYHDLSMTMEIALAYRFTPLLEDDESIPDVSERFSPKPERHESSKAGLPTDLTTHLNEHSRRTDLNGRSGGVHSSAIRGHPAIRPKSSQCQTKNTKANTTGTLQDRNLSEEGEHSGGNQRIRHISMSNPLVKCKQTDKLQNVIDLMVTTDANLVVVIGQSSNHVIGVVTIADVLNFIVTPPGHTTRYSPSRVHRRSRTRLSSSTNTSLPSVRDEPENSPIDEVTMANSWHGNGRRHLSKHSTSSDTSSANDSGYSSASKLNKDAGSVPVESNHVNSSLRALRRGVEIERA